MGAQGAYSIGESFGQHGYHAVDQINGGSPDVGFILQNGVEPDIVGHIGNVHPNFPEAILQFLDREGIVKILGIGGVNGKSRNLSKIPAFCYLFVRNFQRNFICCLIHFFRIFIWKAKFGQNGMHFGIVGTSIAKYINDLGHRISGIFGPVQDPGNRLLSVFGSLQALLGNKQIEGHSFGGNQEGRKFGDLNGSNQGFLCPFDHFNHFTFGIAFFPAGEQPDFDFVAIEGVVHVGGLYQDR